MNEETPKFTKREEDFVCEHCGNHVKGIGYTNHCPKCLWSKHVDINPGDRAANCGGMMRPISIEYRSGEYRIVHKCEKCGYEKINDSAPEDDFEEIINILKDEI